jgi:cytochrome P450
VGALHLPANTTVVVGIGAVNRDPVIWGGDAEEWKPERWIGKQVEQVAGEKLPGVYSGMCVNWSFLIVGQGFYGRLFLLM